MDLTQEQVRAFVGPNADYYLERWHRIEEFGGSRALGFNWAAFFGTGSWLVYRRMYRTFSIALGSWLALETCLVLALAVALSNKASGLALMLIIVLGAVPIGLPVIFGIYGTYWYYLHARREIGGLTPDGQKDLQTVAGRGGSNLWGAVTSAAVFTSLYLMIKPHH